MTNAYNDTTNTAYFVHNDFKLSVKINIQDFHNLVRFINNIVDNDEKIILGLFDDLKSRIRESLEEVKHDRRTNS